MNVKEAVSTANSEAVIASTSEEVPQDINLENRKNIIRKELNKLLGKSLKEKHEDNIRLKQRAFDKKKARRKMAHKSQKRNW